MGKEMKQRNQEIKELRAKGLTYGKIRDFINKKYGCDISRQRIHQIASGYRPPTNQAKWTQELYESIKRRDDFTCQWAQLCDGNPKKPKELIVHHLDFDNINNNPSNLITVCVKCHASFHSNNHVDDKIKENLHQGGELIDRIKMKCGWCGKEFEVTPNERKRYSKDYYCAECRGEIRDNRGFQYYMMAKEGLKLKGEISEIVNTTQSRISAEIHRIQKLYNLPDLNLRQKNKGRSKNNN